MAMAKPVDVAKENAEEKLISEPAVSSNLTPNDNEVPIDELVSLLRNTNLYDDLYQVLLDNSIDFEILENHLPEDEINTFCQEFGFTYKQKLKFRKLMREVYKNKKQKQKNNNDNNLSNQQSKQSKSHPYDIGVDYNVDEQLQIQAMIESELKNKMMTQGQPIKKHNRHKRKIKIKKKLIYSEEGLEGMVEETCYSDDEEQEEEETKMEEDERMALQKGRRYLKMKELEPTDTMEVALVGDSEVGKTSLMRQYVQGTFNLSIASSIGVECMTETEKLHDGTIMEINVRDTAGQERFQSICKLYYRKADCIIVCYDVNNNATFDSCTKWRDAIEDNGMDDVVVMLVGCKIDKVKNNEHRKLAEQKAKEIIAMDEWKKYNATYCECSAKTCDNVRNIFVMAAELVLQRRHEIQQVEQKNPDDEDQNIDDRKLNSNINDNQINNQNNIDNEMNAESSEVQRVRNELSQQIRELQQRLEQQQLNQRQRLNQQRPTRQNNGVNLGNALNNNNQKKRLNCCF